MDQTLNLRDEKRLDKLGLGYSLGLEDSEQLLMQIGIELPADILALERHANDRDGLSRTADPIDDALPRRG